MTDVTRILSAIQQGDTKASDHLMRLVYHELRKLAAARLYAEEDKGISIQPTLLVHEAYLRLVDADTQQGWCGRGHFFAAAAEAMRRILVESARRKASLKHGGAMRRVDLGLELADGKQLGDDILALNEALTRLETQWPEKALLVKLRYFSGLTISEASRELGISTATAERHWRFARAWLHTQLTAND